MLVVHNGKVWEKPTLHLKSAIPRFNRHNIVAQIHLDLLKAEVRGLAQRSMTLVIE